MYNIFNMEAGKRIRYQRELLKISREKLAEYLDVSPKFISDIELGIKGMSVKTLVKLSNVLKLSVDYILFGENRKTNTNHLLEAFSLCPSNKIEYAEDLLKLFLKAIV